MAPQSTTQEEEGPRFKDNAKTEYKLKIKWVNVFIIASLHLCYLYGFYLLVTQGYLKTFVFEYIYGVCSGIGLTAGAHRLWCHRSYKAKLPLRILLSIFHSMAAQTDIYSWSRDHRVHHKFTETDADPHTITRGFFFAHVGWLMCKKHPEVSAKGKTVYLDDLMADPVVRFQRRFHIPLALFFSFFLPTMIPVWLWKEDLYVCCFGTLFRYVGVLNFTWSINSVAHLYGDRPFDKSMKASESPYLSFFASGEGWHNYHHVFPWDYSTSELGNWLNISKIFIDSMAKIGQAYDLKQATPEAIYSRKLKTGDGSRL